VPRQDGVALVVEDELALAAADHENGVTFARPIDYHGHPQSPTRQARLDQELSLDELDVLAVADAILRVVPTVLDTPVLTIREC